ncbi:AAA family ATPase [Rhizobium laguerreae]|uniref:AAA family ATPase n=1 Tax=Rhizobium laguerreae TaxID=1076926 RepID=UPI001C92A704|nr:AAA family ATPase [Rhizobium laguerreae]MBY3265304.1 AAA family ATPase [Rhizobium laguerreae]MBY3337745.1 AAA family ATPase [Rhizobium laguerreae]
MDKALFWSLGGPAAFVRQVVETAYRHGFVALQVPSYHPPGLLEAVCSGFEEVGISPVHNVRAQARGSAVHQMAAAAGITGAGMRSVGGFFDLPTLRGSMFMVDGVERGDWAIWAPFFRSFISERRRRRDGLLLPTLVAVIHPNTPRGDVERLFPGAIVSWRDRVSSFDIRTYVSKKSGRGRSDLFESAATEITIGLAGYDPVLAHALLDMLPSDAIDPWNFLKKAYGANADTHPHWANGLVDYVDGNVFVHTAALIAAGDRRSFDIRRWKAVSGPILDFNAMVCRHFADSYSEILERQLPHVVQTPWGNKTIDHRYGLESKHLRDLLTGTLEYDDEKFMRAAAKARNEVAHNNVPEHSLIEMLSNAWLAYTTRVPAEARGWYWPRCGQRLILMVGPSGAGKSTYAKSNFASEEIVSTDQIRLELFGAIVKLGTQSEVFSEAAARIVERLSRGDNAVLDATNLRKRDRLRVVDLVPPDFEVHYVIVDRPMEKKRVDGGWRNERAGLLDGHAHLFESEIDTILTGDGRSNVVVTDVRDM